MEIQSGLRERKKKRTRLTILETAKRLFLERGFDNVSVAEIAREAEVSEATVFNYFPTKEDLVYHGLETFETELLAAISQRPIGDSVLDAFGHFVIEPRGLLAAEDKASQATLLSITRMIATSPTLLARQRQILASYTESVAALLQEETGSSPQAIEPWIVASTLVGFHGTLVDYVQRRLLEGTSDLSNLANDLRREGEKALQLLRGGLSNYAVKE